MSSRKFLTGIVISVLVITTLLLLAFSPSLLGFLGEIYLERESYEAAIKASSAAIRLKPDSANLYKIRAESFKNTDYPVQALEDINQAIFLYENDWAYHSLRGRINHDLGKLDEALDDYAQSLALFPANPDTYFNRSLVYLDLMQYDEVIADLNTVIELDPSYADAYFNRGILYWGYSELDKAKIDLSRAVELYRQLGLRSEEQTAQNTLEEINSK